MTESRLALILTGLTLIVNSIMAWQNRKVRPKGKHRKRKPRKR